MLGLSSLFWGVSFILTKEIFAIAPTITVFQLISFRLLLASIVLLPILAINGTLERIRKGDLKWFLLLALAEPFLYYIMETNALRLVSGSLTSVIIATIPLFVTITYVVLYRQKLHASLYIGVILSLIGVIVMLLGDGGLNIGANDKVTMLKGLALLVGAVIVAVAYTLLIAKVADHYQATTVIGYQNIIGLIYYLPVMLFFDGDTLVTIPISAKLILLILCLGVFCSALGYIFYCYGVQYLGPAAACVFNNIIPIFTLLAALAIGQEHFGWAKLIGMIVALAGATLAQLKSPEPVSQRPVRNKSQHRKKAIFKSHLK